MAVAYTPRFSFESQALIKTWSFAIFCSFISAFATALYEDVGPKFPEDRRSTFAYSNLVGGKLVCKAVGEPKPSIQWLTADFFPVPNIPSVREVSPEYFLLFIVFQCVISILHKVYTGAYYFHTAPRDERVKGLTLHSCPKFVHQTLRRFSGNLRGNARKWNVIFVSWLRGLLAVQAIRVAKLQARDSFGQLPLQSFKFCRGHNKHWNPSCAR